MTRTYENQSGTLVTWQDLEGIESESGSNLGLGDYDNDGDLDLAMAGLTAHADANRPNLYQRRNRSADLGIRHKS